MAGFAKGIRVFDHVLAALCAVVEQDFWIGSEVYVSFAVHVEYVGSFGRLNANHLAC